ncbi:hypothetical protein Pla52n_23520 [Stieleria varia]|uniref:Uncharacterized protein n=2 Tax=Stieleria varia TaxID=2528005 RepID=A0A5C6AYV8_9BACT|nr:hypothetical protein Pla52n_23520 [Stieleria varia]
MTRRKSSLIIMNTSQLCKQIANVVRRKTGADRKGRGRVRSSRLGMERFEDRRMMTVAFYSLPDHFLAVDQGFDTNTDTTYLVGAMNQQTDSPIATLVTSVDLETFQVDELIGLGPGTQVGGISSDGVRIAGVSKSPGTISVGEGTTWLSSAPDSPTGIGLVPGNPATSVAISAWSGGVVGDQGGIQDGIVWTPTGGLVVLPDGGGLSTAVDVSVNGDTSVGFASSIVLGSVGAAYWDSTGFHALPTPSGDPGVANAISPIAEFIGGNIAFFDPATFDGGLQATVWTLVDSSYEPTLLTWSDGSRVRGSVVDVSDSGYAVVSLSSGGAAIYHADVGVLSLADFVALHGDGMQLPDPNVVPVAISDVADGVIQIAFETLIIKVDVNDGITTVEGTEGSDNITQHIAAGESLRIHGNGGNDRITVFVDGPGATLIVDGGTGDDHIVVYNRAADSSLQIVGGEGDETVSLHSTNASDAAIDVDLGGGADTFMSYVIQSPGIASFVDMGSGDDAVYNHVRESDSSVLGFDLGEGTDRFSSYVFYSTNVSAGVFGAGGDARVSHFAYASPGFVQATVLGEGNHRVTNYAYYSNGGRNAVSVGGGRSIVYDYVFASDDVHGVYDFGDGRSVFTGYAMRSNRVTHEVFASSAQTRSRGFAIGSLDYSVTRRDLHSELSTDPVGVLDAVFAEVGTLRLGFAIGIELNI